MFSRLSRRFTYANIAATLALVFAMSGGAMAATHYLLTSTKQISPKVLKALRGQNGTAGPAGAAGAQGPQGSQGSQGAAGPGGAQGAKGETGPAGAPGAKGEKGEKGTSGEPGSPWTAGGTLPSSKSETGVWAISGAETPPGSTHTQLGVVASFPIPLAVAPTPYFIGPEEGEGEPSENKEIFQNNHFCEGTIKKAKAAPGNLCVFEGPYRNALFFIFERVETSGATAFFSTEPGEPVEPYHASGVWVVTAK